MSYTQFRQVRASVEVLGPCEFIVNIDDPRPRGDHYELSDISLQEALDRLEAFAKTNNLAVVSLSIPDEARTVNLGGGANRALRRQAGSQHASRAPDPSQSRRRVAA